MQRILKCASALLALALLSGCSIGSVAIVDTESLCKDWRHQSVSKQDKLTEGTAAGIEASNDSRPNWGCKLGENAAKS